RSRLALVALVGAAAWIAVLGIGFNVLLDNRLRSQAVAYARDRAEAVSSTTEVVGDGVIDRERVDNGALDAGVWLYSGSTVVERPRAPADVQSAVDALVGNGERFVRPQLEPHVLLYALPIMSGERQVGTVVTSISLQPYERSAQLLLLGSIGVALAVLAGVYAGARIVVSRALRPVEQMTKQASDWSSGDVNRRFAPVARFGELNELADNLDGMLDRIAAALRHEQQLSAELSHELRTPLAHILVEAELLAQSTDPDAVAAQAGIARSAERMNGILTMLLQAARVEAQSSPGRCDVSAVAATCVEDWPRNGPEVTVTGERGVPAGVTPEVVERILHPLLDNARRFARTRVVLDVRATRRGPLIAVCDDGPGVPAADAEDVFAPGFTSDDAHDGAGLGLPLARRLARAAGGEIACEPSADGARFVVSLPPG
ncbi:MAG: Histidine kinase, partial [Frankiales bacterium]|nr:Histidine kinase [Frankiales bacterium]